MNSKKIHLSAIILSLLATSAIAQETFELDDIVISGGNSPIKAADLATSNSVITSEDIKKHGDVTIQSLLRQIPGIAVANSRIIQPVTVRRGVKLEAKMEPICLF